MIFPIKGKLSNALTTPTAKYFANEEVAGLFKIFGYDGYKKKKKTLFLQKKKVLTNARKCGIIKIENNRKVLK